MNENNLYLPTKIAPITDAQKKDNVTIQTFNEGELADAIWTSNGWWDRDRHEFISPEPTHYLPDGLPDPSAAVEVFESEVVKGVFMGLKAVELDSKTPIGTKVGVFKL